MKCAFIEQNDLSKVLKSRYSEKNRRYPALIISNRLQITCTVDLLSSTEMFDIFSRKA